MPLAAAELVRASDSPLFCPVPSPGALLGVGRWGMRGRQGEKKSGQALVIVIKTVKENHRLETSDFMKLREIRIRGKVGL